MKREPEIFFTDPKKAIEAAADMARLQYANPPYYVVPSGLGWTVTHEQPPKHSSHWRLNAKGELTAHVSNGIATKEYFYETV